MAYRKDIGTRFFKDVGQKGMVILDNEKHCPVLTVNRHDYGEEEIHVFVDRILDYLNKNNELCGGEIKHN